MLLNSTFGHCTCTQLRSVSVVTRILQSLYLSRNSDVNPFSGRPFSTESYYFQRLQVVRKKNILPNTCVLSQNKIYHFCQKFKFSTDGRDVLNIP
jgi:hypothetical protein